MKFIFMKTFLAVQCLVALMCLLSSCESYDSMREEFAVKNSVNESTLSEEDAQKAFAKILSVAVAKDGTLRSFLKNEAVKQYDKDCGQMELLKLSFKLILGTVV